MGKTIIKQSGFYKLNQWTYSNTTSGNTLNMSYNEYLFKLYKNGQNACGIIYLPKAIILTLGSGSTIRYDTGGFGTNSAFCGLSLWIKNTSGTYTVGCNWAVTEGGAGNLVVEVWVK